MADEPGKARAGRLGRRCGALFVLVIALAFVGSSLYQLTASIFDWRVGPLAAAPPDECVRGIRGLERALDEAGSRADWSTSADVEKTCEKTPEGAEAYVALLRLRRAHEGLAQRRTEEVDPLRESLEVRLAPR
jgi:hypothetical protein